MKLRINEDNFYRKSTNKISKLPSAIKEFMETPENTLTYNVAHNAADAYFNMYKYVQRLDDLDYESVFEGLFYVIYRPFVDKCKEIVDNSGSISGYGIDDYERLKIIDFCRAVDYNFPYGWRRQGEYVMKYGW